MGTNYYLIDLEKKAALDVGKFYALAYACGVQGDVGIGTVTKTEIEESRTGWLMKWSKYRPGRPDERKDIAWSRYLANLVEAWVDEIAGGSALIYSEIEDMPWPTDELGYPLEDLDEWTLWTLYIHPVHDGAEPPWHLWEKTAHAES